MTTDDNEESVSSWNSLFLPLEEEVIFASFITLFCPTQPSQGREQQEREPQHQQRRVSTVDEADQYSAAEGENLPRNATGEDTRSPLFLLCGERADSVACVLRNRQVVFFDMTDERHGPKEVRRLRGTKNLRGCSSSEATCASLIPIEVAYMCRVPAAAMPPATPSPDAAGGGGAGGGVARPSNSLAVDMTVLQSSLDRVMYLRGVVGSNDGRVDVFSEHSYVFGFVAHDTPVVAVSAIYSGCASQEGDRDGARLNNGGDVGVVLPPFGNDDERRFENATANMGFVTCGSDGVLYVWKRQGLYLKPRVLEKSAFFSRTIKWQVVQPSCRDWLLGGMCTGRVPLVVHTTPGLEHELRARSSVTFDDAEPRVELPGALPTRTTAVASDGEVALVGRGRRVYRVVFAESRCELVFTAQHTVTGMHMSRAGVAAATCNTGGLLYILTLRPVAVLGCYSVRGGGPIHSVALHPESGLVALVGGDGTVEVARMPGDWVAMCGQQHGADVMDAIPAARALHCLTQLQQKQADGVAAVPRPLNEAQQAATQETLLLARMAIPQEANRYLHTNARVA